MKHLGTKNLETKRLILRKLTLNDAEEAYNNWCNDFDVTKYVTWSVHEGVESTKKLYEKWANEYEDSKTYRWIVELKSTHELIGTIDATIQEGINDGTLEIGYCYGKKFWGMGYGTEALKEVIKYLFEECEAETLYARHLTNNPASGKVMLKSGMTYEASLKSRMYDKLGIRNDIAYYSILRNEYLKMKNKVY